LGPWPAVARKRLNPAMPPCGPVVFSRFSGSRVEKKTLKYMFFGSHFEHLLAIFVVLLVRAKGQNTVIYNVSVYLSIHDYIFIFLSIYPVSVST
jgi:hypothetical protein